MGLAALKRLQLGLESTSGTNVPATAKLMGVTAGHALGDRVITQPDEDRGNLSAAFRTFTPTLLWQDTLRGSLTFEDALYYLSMAVKGGVSPTTVDTSARLWTFTPSLTAANAPDTYTLEIGENTQEYEAEFCFAESLEITGAAESECQFSAGIVGRQLSASTFTPALSDRTVESALAYKTSLYMDDTGGTIGSTQKTGTLLDWRWRLPQHFVRKRQMDGNQFFSSYSEVKMRPELELTVELVSNVVTLRTKYTAETRQLVRLKVLGSLCGAVTALRTLQIDGAYKITGFDTIDERNGASIVKLHLMGEYDPTYAKLFEIAVQNSLQVKP